MDASAVVIGLLHDGDARALLAEEAVICPHLADSEIAHTLRRQVLRARMDESHAEHVLEIWSQLGVRRAGVAGTLTRIWELRSNLSAYDATYVALAEAFEVSLVTADGRLGRAPGVRCPVTVVRG